MIEPRVLHALVDAQVRVCLIGAQALAFRGVARYSVDVDLLTFDHTVLRKDFWPTDLTVEQRWGDHADPLDGVVRVRVTPPIDIVVGKGAAMKFALDSAEAVTGAPIPVASRMGLILLKLEAGGPKDLADIATLVAAEYGGDTDDALSEIDQHADLLSSWGNRSRARLGILLSA